MDAAAATTANPIRTLATMLVAHAGDARQICLSITNHRRFVRAFDMRREKARQHRATSLQQYSHRRYCDACRCVAFIEPVPVDDQSPRMPTIRATISVADTYSAKDGVCRQLHERPSCRTAVNGRPVQIADRIWSRRVGNQEQAVLTAYSNHVAGKPVVTGRKFRAE